jgi:hypothetical protein
MTFVSAPSMHQMIQAGSTDVAPPSYEHVAAPYQPASPYDNSPSAPVMGQPLQPYGVQPTMGQPYSPMSAQMGSLPMGTPMVGHVPMGSPVGGQAMVQMGQPFGQPFAMVGVPIGQPYEQKGPAYPSPAQPDPTTPPSGDWKSMRSPWPVLTLPRLWLTRDVNISLLPAARKDHEVRCLQFVHEPGVPMPEGLDVTDAGSLVGQPTTAMFLKEYYFMARLQTGLSPKEKTKRRTAREKEHQKIIKTQKKAARANATQKSRLESV